MDQQQEAFIEEYAKALEKPDDPLGEAEARRLHAIHICQQLQAVLNSTAEELAGEEAPIAEKAQRKATRDMIAPLLAKWRNVQAEAEATIASLKPN
ncbi:unnamed protein product, partial [Mesorhabditis spiculigera]